MRWIAAGRAAAFAAAGLVLAAPGAATPGSSAPHLALVGTDPPSVRGTGFHTGEHVRVVLRRRAGEPRVAEAIARGSGVFTATFPAVRLNRCAAFSVVAEGSRGSRATLRRTGRMPGCGPGARGPAPGP
jgi:hypothetical protein